MDELIPTWKPHDLHRAPTWLPSFAAFADKNAPTLFREVIARFRALRHLAVPFDEGAPASAQLEALVAKHPQLRSLHLTSATKGLSTAPLAALALDRLLLSGRLMRDAEGPWSTGLGRLRELSVTVRDPVKLPDPRAWAGLLACESITLLFMELDVQDLREIAALPRLTRLTLRHCQIAAGALSELAASASLRRLTVSGAPLEQAEAAALAEARALEIVAAPVGAAKHIRALRPLAERGLALAVTLVGRTQLDDALVAAICAELPGLAGLSLDQNQIVGLTKKFSPAGLAPIGQLRGLRWLNLDGIYVRGIKPADLAFLRELGGLRSLSLRSIGKLSAAVVDELGGLTELRALNLRGVPLSDAAAKKLAPLPLRRLALSDVKLGPKGFAALAALPQLTHLAVAHATGYSDAMLDALAPAAALQSLELDASVSVSVQVSTLAPLTRLPALRALAVAEKGHSDAWLASLAGAPALERLHFTRSDSAFPGGQLSDAAVHAGLRIPTLRTISHWSFQPSEAGLAAVEAAERGAWLPGDYAHYLAIEATEEAPLGD